MKSIFFSFLIITPFFMIAQNSHEKIIYLIPGQGSDERLFKNISINHYETRAIKYEIPEKGATMATYAQQLSAQIDTSLSYSLIGVSLGGMLAMEMAKQLNPDEVILIASAKNRNEIPRLYKFFRKFPLHLLFGGNFYKFWTLALQPLYEPMPKEDQRMWRDMMKQKNPKFMRRAVRCIIEWENEDSAGENVLHIHGTKDKTLPIKNIEEPVIVEDGTHVMTLTKGEEISAIINQWLSK
ncbi:MAG: alpha/beta hydrolase [Bacteroidota bacterium]